MIAVPQREQKPPADPTLASQRPAKFLQETIYVREKPDVVHVIRVQGHGGRHSGMLDRRKHRRDINPVGPAMKELSLPAKHYGKLGQGNLRDLSQSPKVEIFQKR